MSPAPPLPTDDRRQLAGTPYSTRIKPQTPPTVGAFDHPLVGCCINHEWARHIAGSTASLEWASAWNGTPTEIQFALDQIVKIQEHMNCSCGGGCSVCNANAVQSYRLALEIEFGLNDLDGIAPNRPDTTFDTDSGDVGNDKIQRENALCLAVRDYVNTVADDAVAFGIGLGLTIGGGFAPILYGVAPIGALVFFGATTIISAAWAVIANDPEVRDDVACCMLEGLTGKTVTQVNFAAALDNCSFTFGSDKWLMQQVVKAGIDDQGNWLAFIRILGSYFSYANIDPIFCFCTEPQFYCSFVIDRCGFIAHIGPNGPEAAYVDDTGWEAGPSGVINHFVNVHETFSEDIAFTMVRIFLVYTGSSNITYKVELFDEFGASLFDDSATVDNLEVVHEFNFSEVTGVRQMHICALKTGLETEFPGFIVAVETEADIAPFLEQPI